MKVYRAKMGIQEELHRPASVGPANAECSFFVSHAARAQGWGLRGRHE